MSAFEQIQIRGLVSNAPYWYAVERRWLNADELVSAAQIIRQIEDAKARGTRVLLVSINSAGGVCRDNFDVYAALRAFSDAGGTVITRVEYAASMATVVALAGDFVAIAPGGRFVVHSMFGGSREGIAATNAEVLDVYLAATLSPRADLEKWLALEDNEAGAFSHAELPAETALSLGWADWNADEERARKLAQAAADGVELMSERSFKLWARRGPARPARPSARIAPDLVGAKIQNAPGGTAMLVAPGNLKIGTRILSELGAFRARAVLVGSQSGSTTVWSAAPNALNIDSVSVVAYGVGTGNPSHAIRVEFSDRPDGFFDYSPAVFVGTQHTLEPAAGGLGDGMVNRRAVYLAPYRVPGPVSGSYTRGVYIGVQYDNAGVPTWLVPSSITFVDNRIHVAVLGDF
jgi:ATP-dependent protease ClpP protease subunit